MIDSLTDSTFPFTIKPPCVVVGNSICAANWIVRCSLPKTTIFCTILNIWRNYWRGSCRSLGWLTSLKWCLLITAEGTKNFSNVRFSRKVPNGLSSKPFYDSTTAAQKTCKQFQYWSKWELQRLMQLYLQRRLKLSASWLKPMLLRQISTENWKFHSHRSSSLINNLFTNVFCILSASRFTGLTEQDFWCACRFVGRCKC